MTYKELHIEEFKSFQPKIFELITDTYVMSFRISIKEAQAICFDKTSSLENYIDNGSAVVIGCVEENNLLGIIWVYVHEFFGEKRLHVNQIAVDKKQRGKGIGKNLIYEAEKKAVYLGITTIDLFVSEVNEKALNLYDSLGFETERRYMRKVLQVSKK